MFDRRVHLLKRRLSVIEYVGLAVPLAAGGLVLAGVKVDQSWLTVAGVIGAFQVLFVAWSLVQRHPDALESAVEGRKNNRELAELYDSATKEQPADTTWAAIEAKREAQTSLDEKENFSDEEKRFGMRFALRQYQWSCATCDQKPSSMSPGKCDTCGNFNPKWVR